MLSLGSVEQVLFNKHRWAARRARTAELTDSRERSPTAGFMLHDMRSATQTDKEKLAEPLWVETGEVVGSRESSIRAQWSWSCKCKLKKQKWEEKSSGATLHRWAGEGNTLVLHLGWESEDLLVVMGEEEGGEMYAVCRLNLFHMTSLGLFLSTALLSSEESGSVTTWLPKRHRGEKGGKQEREGGGAGTRPMQHAWWGVITNPIQSAVKFVNIHTFTFHCLSTPWPKSSTTHTHTHWTHTDAFSNQVATTALSGLAVCGGVVGFRELVVFPAASIPFQPAIKWSFWTKDLASCLPNKSLLAVTRNFDRTFTNVSSKTINACPFHNRNIYWRLETLMNSKHNTHLYFSELRFCQNLIKIQSYTQAYSQNLLTLLKCGS